MNPNCPAMKLTRTVKLRKYGTGSCAVKVEWLCQLHDYRKQTRLSMRAVAEAVGLWPELVK